MERIVSPYFLIVAVLYLYTFVEAFLKLFLPSLSNSFFETGFWIINIFLFLPMIMLILYVANMKLDYLGDKENIVMYITTVLMILSGLLFQIVILPLV